jgi:nitrite reductase (NADH) small subunit
MTDVLIATWTDVCSLDDLLVERGACVLVDGRQVALFRLADGIVRAVSNFDPFSAANVISRGIVGCTDGRCKVTSPMFKQSFDLETGACLEDPSVALAVFEVRVVAGRVEVRSP